MRLIARTGRSTGISAGPVGLFFLALGWLVLATLVAVGAVIFCASLAARWGADALRERRRLRATAPHPAPDPERVRGHREPSPYERSLAAQRRR